MITIAPGQLPLLDVFLLDVTNINDLGLKLLSNLLVTLAIVVFIYRPANDKPEYTFTYIIFNILIFFLCYLMATVEIGIGFGFGLFALFSIMRYRTTTISIKDMTYLFAVVCVAVINAVSINFSYTELLLINGFILSSILISEKLIFKTRYEMKKVTYEYVDRIKPEMEETLISDLEQRTGRKIAKVEISSMNYLTDSAVLYVYFYPPAKASKVKYETVPVEETNTPA